MQLNNAAAISRAEALWSACQSNWWASMTESKALGQVDHLFSIILVQAMKALQQMCLIVVFTVKVCRWQIQDSSKKPAMPFAVRVSSMPP